LFDRAAGSSLAPTADHRGRPGADAVKAGRHPKHAARSLAYRPSLHGGEHGGRLDPLGRTIRSQLTQCPFSNRWFLTSFPPLLTLKVTLDV